jgi:hypothetical protein
MLKNSRSTLSRTSGHKHTILSPRIWNCEFCHIGYEILVFCNNWFCHLRLFFSLVRSSQFRILETKLSRVQNWGYFMIFGGSRSIKGGLNGNFRRILFWALRTIEVFFFFFWCRTIEELTFTKIYCFDKKKRNLSNRS